MEGFVQGSALHILCLAVSLAATLATVRIARSVRDKEELKRPWRIALAISCLASWLLSNGYALATERFHIENSLPLQFCNLANLIGAHALLTRQRLSQTILYFWTFSLCLWAFLTPSLYVGPDDLWFWLFWIYHLFIPVSIAWVLVADRYRPTWRDCRKAIVLTLAYMALLAALNGFTGWNYGFVGPDKPTQRSIMDVLGPYPIRLISMAAVGTTLFFLLMLPWMRSQPKVAS